MRASEFATWVRGAQQSGNGYVAFCPGHADRNERSLSFRDKDGKLLVNCFAGCTKDAIVSALRLTLHDLFHDDDTNDERAEYRKQTAPPNPRQDEEQQQQRIEAAQRAQAIVEQASPAPADHPYLVRKKIKVHGSLLSINGELIIQVMIDGKLSSLQFIGADGGKRFLSGGAVAGGSYVLGNATNPNCIPVCEGFATGAVLHESTGLPVVIAFSAGNLSAVAQAIRKQHPAAKIVICGDNDTSGVGQKAAQEAARAVGGNAVIPPREGDDWNDVAVKDGIEAVRAAIDRACDNYDRITVEDLAGSYRVTFLSYDLALHFQRVSENLRGVHAELTVRYGQTDILPNTDISLKSPTSRKEIAKGLQDSIPGLNWKTVISLSCAAVVKRFRHGDPIIKLKPADSIHVPLIVDPFVFRRHQTIWYAPGGSYKSYLALYVALLAMAGLRQNGIAAIRTNVLYLDWELDAETLGTRLKALQIGHPELAHVEPFYRRCTHPLHQEAPQIATEVARLGIGLIIVDSAALATGGDLNSPESAIKLQQALRRIGCASLVLAHVAKAVVEGQDRSVYGSVFFRELARNLWELSKPGEGTRVLLSQASSGCKITFGKKRDPLGFEFSFEPDRVRITAFDPAEEEESGFEDKLPARQRISRLLSDHVHRDAQGIADALHLPSSTVKSELSRGKKDGIFEHFGPHRGGKWSLKKSLQPIVAANTVAPSLQPLQRAVKSAESIEGKGKNTVASIVDGHCNPSLLQRGGYIYPPTATINENTPVNDSFPQPELVVDL